MPTINLLIKGKVQGVFYRAAARDIAQRLGVTGWIKNTDNGDVEAEVSGTDQQLKNFINWCKQGPDKARVSEVISTLKKETIYNEFAII